MYNNGYLERNNLQGPPGIKGEKGDKGEKGIDGNIGIMGPIGPPGSIGPRGPRGMIGEIGYQGLKGEQGVRGKEGRVGLKGDIGLNGNTGEKGNKGIQGLIGINGNQGFIGPTGSDGPFGERGPPGIQGEHGIQGYKGDTGDCGPTGYRGIQGLQGKDGIIGETGFTGETGSSGFTGPTGISIIGMTGTTNGILFSVNNPKNSNYLISWPDNCVNNNLNTNLNTNISQNTPNNFGQGLGYLSTIVGNSYFRLTNNNIPFSEEFSINNYTIIEGSNEEYKIKLNITSSTDYDGQFSNHKQYYKFIRQGMSIKLEGHTTNNNVLDSKNFEQVALFYITEIDLDNLDSYNYITIYAINNKWKNDTSSNLLIDNSWYNISVGYLPKDGKIGHTGLNGIDGKTGSTGSTGENGLTGPTGSSIIKVNQNINLDKGYWYRFANTNLDKALNTFYIENNDTKVVINCSLNKSQNNASINLISNISNSNSIECIRLLYSQNNNNSYLEYFIRDDNIQATSFNNHIILLDSFDNSLHNWNIIDPINNEYNLIATKNDKNFIKQEFIDLGYKIKILDINKNQGFSSTNNINANSIDINNNNIIKLSNNVITLAQSMYTQNYQFSLTLLERNSAIKFNCRGNYTYNEIQNINRIAPLNNDFSLGSFSISDPLELNVIETIYKLNQETKLNFSNDVNQLYKDTFICPPNYNPIFQIYKREDRTGGGGENSSSLWSIQKYKKNFNYYYQDDIIPEIYRNSFSNNIPQGICFSGNIGMIKNISMNLINDNIYLDNINSYSGKIILSNSDEISQKDINLYIEGYISFRIEIHSFNGIKPYINDTRIQYTNWIITNKYHFYKDIQENDWNFEQNIYSQNYKLGCANYGDIISVVFKFVNVNTKQSGEIRNQLTDHFDNNKIKYYPYTIDIQSLKFGLNIQNIEIFI